MSDTVIPTSATPSSTGQVQAYLWLKHGKPVALSFDSSCAVPLQPEGDECVGLVLASDLAASAERDAFQEERISVLEASLEGTRLQRDILQDRLNDALKAKEEAERAIEAFLSVFNDHGRAALVAMMRNQGLELPAAVVEKKPA